MNKEQFLSINRKIGECIPDLDTRKQVLLNEFKLLGLSIENGYKAMQYYYNELCKKRDEMDSIFEGKCFKDKDNEYFTIINKMGALYFKMSYKRFEERKEMYFPDKVISTNKAETFDCKLSPEQIKKLTPDLNRANLFYNEIEFETLQALFDCSLKDALKVNNNRLLAYFFMCLAAKSIIKDNWQSTIEKNNLFLSKNDKPIKAGDLSASKSQTENKQFGKNPKGYEIIDEALKEIKKLNTTLNP